MIRTKRDALLVRRSKLKASIALRRATLANLEAELADVERQVIATGGPPKQYKRLIPRCAKAGEIQRPMLELMRQRGAITAPELAAVMLVRFGLPTNDRAIAYAMDQRCFRALERSERRGLVRQCGTRGHAMLWMLSGRKAP